jgi:SAM-dependent methyltransferase
MTETDITETLREAPGEPAESTAQSRVLLNVGCGFPNTSRVPKYFQTPLWQEVRYDIDPQVQPHVVGSITDMSAIASGCIDALWSSHNLEHLHGFEVPLALAEFRRILKPQGYLLLTLPDMRAIAREIALDRISQTLYNSKAGDITALDMVFGHQASIAQGNHYMAHRTGFTANSLALCLQEAGFDEVRVHEGQRWDLWAIATMPDTPPTVFEELANVMD